MKNFRNKSILWIATAVMLLVILFRFWQQTPLRGDSCEFENRGDVADLEYVNHATCRMHCRDIGKELVEEIYLNGQVNCDKSDPEGEKSDGNPRWALEHIDGGRGKVRIIIEEEGNKHLVITAIRIGEEDRCECS